MEQSPMLRHAARIGYKFKIDPLKVLHSNYFDWAARSAALNVVLEDERKANEKQKQVAEAAKAKQ